MEVSLFSGYELAIAPPQLLTPPENMAEMQHSFNANRLWFIFANVSTTCPVCIQYTARSAYVISSLRPAYAKIYPATREDLAAETFFHAKFNSNLLKSITEDDMITWFGNNSTDEKDRMFENIGECQVTQTPTTVSPSTTSSTTTSPSTSATTTPEVINTTPETTVKSTTEETTTHTQLLNILSVATYTINVDNESISNLTETDSAITDSFFAATSSTDPPAITTTDNSQENMIHDNLILDDDEVTRDKFDNLKLKTTEKPFTKSVAPTVKMPKKELIAETILAAPKHINVEVQEVPSQLERHAVTSEEPPATFAPEIKNDQYILLDKEALWGMLKEVVNDEMKKQTTSKIYDGEKLRRQGFT